MTDQDRIQWNQHYDSVQWTAITVFTGIVTVLLGYSYTKDFQPNSWYYFIGLWFTNLTVYFTASFREFRRHLVLETTDGDTCKFLLDYKKVRKTTTWTPFLFTFAGLDLLWCHQLYLTEAKKRSILLAIVSLVFVCFAGYRGRRAKYAETIPGKAEKPNEPAKAS